MSLISKEEQRLREELQQLEKDKCTYLAEFKRIRDEENAKYTGTQNTNKFPILKSRYLILSLLGKGGYSEVYKVIVLFNIQAFDLEICREVALKLHQFDPSWSEGLKANYIKHAMRENEIHKELRHPRVVRQYDTVEIDNNSFCTVLELCSGPDLYMY
jgi:tousled-like kinase